MAFYGILVGITAFLVIFALSSQLQLVQQSNAYVAGYSAYGSIEKVEMFEIIINQYWNTTAAPQQQAFASALNVSALEDGVSIAYSSNSITVESGSNPSVYSIMRR